MGVIISSCKMPEDCLGCMCVNHESLTCQASKDRSVKREYELCIKPSWCPLIEEEPQRHPVDNAIDKALEEMNNAAFKEQHSTQK